MAHELQIIDGTACFIERQDGDLVPREKRHGPAWHGLGEGFAAEEDITVAEGARRTRADQIVVVKSVMPEIVTLADGRKFVTPDTGNHRLYRLPYPGTDETAPVLLSGKKVVSASYTPFSVADLIELLDGGLGITKKWPLETFGVLGVGDRLFLSFRAEHKVFRGRNGATDDLGGYFLVVVYFDGDHANSLKFTRVRVVCQNTLTMAEANAAASVSLVHTPNIHADTKLFAALMTGLGRAQERADEATEALFRHDSGRAADSDAEAVIAAALPFRTAGRKSVVRAGILDRIQGAGADAFADAADALPGDVLAQATAVAKAADEELERYNARIRQDRLRVWQLFQAERDANPDAGVPYLALQAVGEFAQWRRPSKQLAPEGTDAERVAAAQEHIARALIEGDGRDMQVRAEKAALALVK